jgi:hypothetical protein
LSKPKVYRATGAAGNRGPVATGPLEASRSLKDEECDFHGRSAFALTQIVALVTNTAALKLLLHHDRSTRKKKFIA